jgi:hemerythrin-like domain-containing protein
MKITERLKAEHGVLLTLLDHLEELLRRRAPREALRATVDAIAAAETKHAEVEDELLYGMLAGSLGPGCPSLTALRDDHSQAGRIAQQIGLGLFAEETIRRYAHLLRRHIERETHYFFPLVEELVAEEALNRFGNWDHEHVRREARRTPSAELWLG